MLTRMELTPMLIGLGRDKIELIREPPEDGGWRHPALNLLWTKGHRALAARRVDLDWTVTTEGGLVREAEGDVQMLAGAKEGTKEGRYAW